MISLPPPPEGLDLSADRRPLFVGISFGTWVLAATTVALRVLSRRMKEVPLWVDDWFIIAALVPAVAHVSAMAVYAVSRGLGQHIWVAPPDAFYAWSIALFIAELAYAFTLACVKWSILSFYWRSFNVRESIKIPIWTLAIIVFLWLLIVLVVSILQCKPTRAWWERFNPNHPLHDSEYTCLVDPMSFFLGNAIPTIVTDLMMLALPIPYILNLRLPKGQKVALAGIFAVGIFVTIVSCVRLRVLLNLNLVDPDITWNFIDTGLWSIVEGNIAIFCACLPFLRPVLSKLSFGVLNLSSLASRKQQHSTGTIPKSGTNNRDESLRTWEGDTRFGISTAHARAFSHGGRTDERPFVQLDDGSEQSLAINKRDSSTVNLELKDISVSESGRTSPSPVRDGIMVTREVRMQHDAV